MIPWYQGRWLRPGHRKSPLFLLLRAWLTPKRASDLRAIAWRTRDLRACDVRDIPRLRRSAGHARYLRVRRERSKFRNPLPRQSPLRYSRGAVVPMHVPTQVTGGGLVHRRGHGGQVCGHMMLESVLTDAVKEALHIGNFHHARAAERIQRVIGEAPLANVTAHLPCGVVGWETGEAHFFRV